LYVFLGAGLGGVLRWLTGVAAVALFGPAFPVATLVVNVVGSFAMGVLAGWLALRAGVPALAAPNAEVRLFLGTGVLGGFTTFSAFSLDAVTLWQRGDIALAVLYVGASLALSLGALLAGLAVMSR
jgi:CrcB protein